MRPSAADVGAGPAADVGARRQVGPPLGLESGAMSEAPVEQGRVEHPDIEYREQNPSLADFVRLFESAGWAVEPDRERLERAIQSSWFAVCAFEGDRLVGMGRIVSDGFVHALIVDVIVTPEWQGRGLGAGVMRRLVARCEEAGIGQTQLFCARGKRGFYEGLGFRARPEEAPGMELPERW